MEASNASTDPDGVPSVKMVGSNVATNSSGVRSASTNACCSRCSDTVADSDPTHPA